MERLDAVVVGAGVVGLAVARRLALAGLEVWLLEAEPTPGQGTSSRNSEVIHAGLYYPTGSWKARLCVRGRRMLLDYCAARHVPHRICGKLIVAQGAQQQRKLQAIEQQARINGVDDVRWLDGDAARALEPALACDCALLSPGTGILDSHALMQALEADLANAGGMLVCNTEVVALEPQGPGGCVRMADGTLVHARCVVNAAGLQAPALAASTQGMPGGSVPQAHYAKGQYFTLPGKAPFSRLVYPVPEDGGLGIHLTLDLGGRARFGPDVQWVERADDFSVDAGRATAFEDAVRRYWPGLPAGALQPGYAGIRPKISAPGEPAADFAILGPAEHGLPGVVHLLGIESPGLTACLALADEVAARLGL